MRHNNRIDTDIHALVKRCAARASAKAPSLKNKTIYPHLIWHTTASHLLQSGVDIITIRGWLGHVSLVLCRINPATKARALAACEIADGTPIKKHRRDQPDLIEFLRTL